MYTIHTHIKGSVEGTKINLFIILTSNYYIKKNFVIKFIRHSYYFDILIYCITFLFFKNLISSLLIRLANKNI